MYTVIRDRDSGKAHQLLELARKENAFIITEDKRAFKVKAHGYGFDDVEIVDYEDLSQNNYPNKPALIHNVEKLLNWFFKRFEINVKGFSATLND